MPRDKIGIIDINTLAYISSNKIITYNFEDNTQSYITNKGFSISTFAADYHRGMLVWGTIEEEPKLHFYKPSNTTNPNVNTIQLYSEYEYRHIEFSHMGDFLAVCTGYNLDSKVILHVLETETFLANSFMKHEMLSIPNKVYFNPNDAKMIFLLFDNHLEILHYESVFEKYSTTFDQDKLVKLKYTYEFEEKVNCIYVDSNNYVFIDQLSSVQVLAINLKDRVVELKATYECSSPVTIITSTRDYIITCHQDSTILLRNHFIEDDSSNKYDPFKAQVRMRLLGYNLLQAVFEPTYTYLFAVTDSGKLQKFNVGEIDAENNEEDGDEEVEIRDIPPSYVDIHSFIHSDRPSALNISVDGVSSFCSVISTTGQLKVLDVNSQTEKFSYIEPQVEYTSVLSYKGLALVGDSKGYLRIFDYMTGALIDFIHFYDGCSIDFIVKDHQEKNNLVVVFSKQSSKFYVCCLRQDLNTNSLLIIGHDTIPHQDVNGDKIGKIEEVGFVEYSADQKYLLVSTTSLVLICIDIYKRVDYEEDPRECIRLNSLGIHKTYGKLFPEANKIRINYETKKAHIYGYEERSRVWQKIWRLDSAPSAAELNMAEMKQTDMKYNAKDISDVEVILFNQLRDTNVYYLYDGSLKIWANGRDKEMPFEVDMINSSIKQLQITQNVFLLLATDNSLCAYKYSIGDVTFEPEVFITEPSHSKQLTFDNELYATPLVDELQYKEYLEQNNGKIFEQNRHLIDGLADIKDKLEQMLSENASNPELRKLNREEFLINQKFNEMLEESQTNQIAQIRDQANVLNLKRKAEKFLILKYTRQHMENDYNGISGIKQDLIIYNYTIPRVEGAYQRAIDKAKYRAMIDLRAKVWRRTNKKRDIDFTDFKWTGNEGYIVNIVPGENRVVENLFKLPEEKLEKKAGLAPAYPRQPFETHMWNNIDKFEKCEMKPHQFLYEPFEVNTKNKKINMIFLIFEYITYLKREFNRKYNFVNTSKMAARENIREQQKNIKDICQELDLPYHEDPIPMHELETVDHIFNTKDAEVTVERIYTDEEIFEQDRQRRIKEEEERKKNEDDWLKRGSTDMMNDTLDNRKGLKNKKKGLEKEEWMEGDPAEFTEEQKKAYQEYLEKIKAKEEEERRIREELNENLKKARMEVSKFETNFDRTLSEIFLVKSQLDKLITSYEIYSLKLLMSIYSDEHIPDKLDMLKTKIETLKQQLEEFPLERDLNYTSESRDNDPKRNKDRKDPSNQSLQELAKLFYNDTKEKYQKNPNAYQLDLNYLKALFNTERMETQNTYWDKELAFFKEYIVRRVSQPPLGFKKKGRDEGRMLYDKVKKDITDQIEQAQKDVSFLQTLKHVGSGDPKEEEESQYNYLKIMLKPDLIIQVTANKIEIGTYDDPKNYKDARLIFKQQILECNESIDEFGNKIKENLVNRKKNEFKKRRYDLERDCHHYSGEVYRALTEALQMLKVTKELQNKLNYIDIKSENNFDVNQHIERNKREKLEKRIQKYDMQMSKKFESQGDEIERLARDIERYERERSRLDSEMSSIDQKLNKFTKIKLTETEDAKDSSKRMKDVARKRRMLDQMKAYQEEIDFLKEELDKLRAKTFPSFAHTKPTI